MVNREIDKAAIQAYFGNQSVISLKDLRTYFKEIDSKTPDSTIRWRVHNLVRSSILHRVGRGLFQLGGGNHYQPQLSSRSKKVITFIRKNFPEITFCVWNSDLLNEFAHHLSAYPFVLVDVERDVTESVYYQLKNDFSGVFLRPSQMLISDLLPDFRLPLVVRYLTTESPLNVENGLPQISLEKLLVDIFCDPEFAFLSGSELRSIFINATKRYSINENRLLRYADRKGRKLDLLKYLHDLKSLN